VRNEPDTGAMPTASLRRQVGQGVMGFAVGRRRWLGLGQ
jgi:hypothetical protein